MAKVNLTLPNLGIDELSDSQVIRKIASYLYIQNEQLRYELTHIDEDNMSSEEGATYQGMTQAQVQKAIEEAAKKTQDIDLSSNTIIINLQRRLDNLGKLQSQDAANITRITQELGNKVSTNTYNAGLSGLRALINGNTNLITTLSNNYSVHKHSITINDTTGAISMGGPTANPSFPNISATTYFKNKVAEAKREARPHSIEAITLSGKIYSGNATVFCLDDAEFDVPIRIDASTVYEDGKTEGEAIGWDDGYAEGVNDGYQTGWNAATGEITLSGHDVIGPKVNTDKKTYTTETKYTVYTQAEYNALLAQYNGAVQTAEMWRQIAESYTSVSYAKSGLTRETDQLYLKYGDNYYAINSRYKYFYTTGSDSWESLYKKS